MKTTIELPDELLTRAKVVAAERRTTLKAMIEHSLRRELMLEDPPRSENDRLMRRNPLGFPVLNSASTASRVAAELIAALGDEEDAP